MLKEYEIQAMATIATMFRTNIEGLEHRSVTYPVGWGLSLRTSPDL